MFYCTYTWHIYIHICVTLCTIPENRESRDGSSKYKVFIHMHEYIWYIYTCIYVSYSVQFRRTGSPEMARQNTLYLSTCTHTYSIYIRVHMCHNVFNSGEQGVPYGESRDGSVIIYIRYTHVSHSAHFWRTGSQEIARQNTLYLSTCTHT